MSRIKICGLFRPCDADAVNRAMPDYAGFVFFQKSHRNVSFAQARALRDMINPAIRTVGVFVNAPRADIAQLFCQKTIGIVQLHGDEDDVYIAWLRAGIPDAQIWKAYKIRVQADLHAASQSKADMVLLDGGAGTGMRFDWTLIRRFSRPFILAGGLAPENIPAAIAQNPYAVDLSSGVETDGVKDAEKINAAVRAARRL